MGNQDNVSFFFNFYFLGKQIVLGKAYDHVWLFNYWTGRADAHLWANISYCGAVGTINNELGLVFKDYQRVKEDVGEEAVKVLHSEKFWVKSNIGYTVNIHFT